jgi:hypothetical protein
VIPVIPSQVITLHLEFSNKHVLKLAQRHRDEHRVVRNPARNALNFLPIIQQEQDIHNWRNEFVSLG